MNNTSQESLFRHFSQKEWKKFKRDVSVGLSERELQNLRGEIENVSLDEVQDIYIPLCNLLYLYYKASVALHQKTQLFLKDKCLKVPYIIGVAGSVAVGKSTTARILKAILEQWGDLPSVEIVTTDGFLFDTEYLERHNLMGKKGHPESYDIKSLTHFISSLKAGKKEIDVPVYCHRRYDILPGKTQKVYSADIIILEGLNIFQVGKKALESSHRVFVSDFIDFGIYVDAHIQNIKEWFQKRFKLFHLRALNDPEAYLYQFRHLSDQEVEEFAMTIWEDINLKNLNENILPFRDRAHLILTKGDNHLVESVSVKKL